MNGWRALPSASILYLVTGGLSGASAAPVAKTCLKIGEDTDSPPNLFVYIDEQTNRGAVGTSPVPDARVDWYGTTRTARGTAWESQLPGNIKVSYYLDRTTGGFTVRKSNGEAVAFVCTPPPVAGN
jgi:hypothetical protein